MKKNKRWSALMVWMFLMIILTLTMYVLISQILPFSKTTSWLQNSSNAYYQAYAWIEDSLYKKKNWSVTNQWYPINTLVSYKYNVSSFWNVVPAIWKWDSDNIDYSKISVWKPIQLKLQPWLNLSNSDFCFKVPEWLWDFKWIWDIIFWSITSNNETLNWENLILWSNILSSNLYCNWSNWFNISSKDWKKLDWNTQNFSTFYNSNCQWVDNCILRLSVINPLKARVWTGDINSIPYLEYQIRMWGDIELYHTTIESSWKSYWFKKDLKVQVPQSTLNQAFDFTVFQ